MSKLVLSTLKATGTFAELVAQARPGDIITIGTYRTDLWGDINWGTFNSGVVVCETEDGHSYFYLNGELMLNENGEAFDGYNVDWSYHNLGIVSYDPRSKAISLNGRTVICRKSVSKKFRALDKNDEPYTGTGLPTVIQMIVSWQSTKRGVVSRHGNTFTHHTFLGPLENPRVMHADLFTIAADEDWNVIGNDVLTTQGQILFLNGEDLCHLPKGGCYNYAWASPGQTIVFCCKREQDVEYWGVDVQSHALSQIAEIPPTPSRYRVDSKNGVITRTQKIIYNGPFERFDENDLGFVIEWQGILMQVIDPI